MKVNDRHDCSVELRKVTLRATPARVAVMRYLERIDCPVDVADVKAQLDREKIITDVATVFRIMNNFLDRGLVKQVSFNEGKFRYELASRPDHHHLICESCGRVEDFSECAIGELEKDILKKKKFAVKNHSLEFYGLCRRCQKRQN